MHFFQPLGGALLHAGIFDTKTEPLHWHMDAELLYVLDGELQFTLDEESFRLGADDFLVVNSNQPHSFQASADVLYAAFQINHYELRRRKGSESVRFYCNSTRADNNAYPKLLDMLRRIVHQCAADSSEGNLYLEGLYFHLAERLLSDFALLEEPAAGGRRAVEAQRDSEIQLYLHNNYNSPVTLEQLAKQLYLTPAYLSKYIKRRFGMNFSKYLNSLRLTHAVEDLRSSGKSMTRIALDNGFPNAASFTRVFKEHHGVTPSEYTARLSPASRRADSGGQHSDAQLTSKVKAYLRTRAGNPGLAPESDRFEVAADVQQWQRYTKNWSRMINIGPSADLFSSDMREHLLMMKKELGIQYVRFWDFYSPILFLDIGAGRNRPNFTKLNRLLDFLVDNELHPYIELGFKPRLLMRSFYDDDNQFMVSQPREILFGTPEDYEYFLQAFISHCVNRYGQEEVEQWCFEQWLDPRYEKDGDWTEYFHMFEAAHRALKSVSPHLRLGGGGLNVLNQPCEKILALWHSRTVHPDFISLYCFPYVDIHQNHHNSMATQIGMLRGLAESTGFTVPEIHVSEWNFTVSDRNTLNDSPFKGAYIVKNMLECMQHTELMGYWYASDLLSEYDDTNQILNGSGGLISRDGIKKPAYHAFRFLSGMGRYLIHRDAHCCITTNGHGNFIVVCHNYKPPNFKYFLKLDEHIHINEHPNYFAGNDKKQLAITLHNLKNGLYTVKTHSVSNHNGSAQDEWIRMGLAANINKQEIDYLKRISTPRISAVEVRAHDNRLTVETGLDPQEIQYIHISYQMDSDFER